MPEGGLEEAAAALPELATEAAATEAAATAEATTAEAAALELTAKAAATLELTAEATASEAAALELTAKATASETAALELTAKATASETAALELAAEATANAADPANPTESAAATSSKVTGHAWNHIKAGDPATASELVPAAATEVPTSKITAAEVPLIAAVTLIPLVALVPLDAAITLVPLVPLISLDTAVSLVATIVPAIISSPITAAGRVDNGAEASLEAERGVIQGRARCKHRRTRRGHETAKPSGSARARLVPLVSLVALIPLVALVLLRRQRGDYTPQDSSGQGSAYPFR